MLEWLEARRSDTHLQQVFWEARQRTHLLSQPASLDPLQLAYRSNLSTDDAIAFTLHTALSHLENKNTYVRMLFVDYSSAFNTIVSATLVAKLQTLGLNRSLCSCILDFLTGRSQVVRMGNNTSSPLILNAGAPQGCVLSPLLYSLYTHDSTATHSSNVIFKFADDTMVISLISDNDETAYREEVSTLTKWCQENHLSHNIDALQRVMRTARHIVGGELPSLQDIYTRRCIRKSRRITKDSSHLSHRLLSLLPSGRHLRSIRSRTTWLRDSFFPQAIRLINSKN